MHALAGAEVDAEALAVHFRAVEQARLQLTRDPRPLPTMTLNPAVQSIFDFRFGDFTLENYDPHPSIKAPIAV